MRHVVMFGRWAYCTIPCLMAARLLMSSVTQKRLDWPAVRRGRAENFTLATVAWSPSVEAMGAFASDDPLRVHHLPIDPEFPLELPERVQLQGAGGCRRDPARGPHDSRPTSCVVESHCCCSTN